MTAGHARDEAGVLGVILARYSATALEPDLAAMERIRAELRAKAQHASVRRRAEALALSAVPTVAVPLRRPFRSSSPRRFSLALAAALVLGLTMGTSAFAASRAGGPLYGARIWLEEVTLPADPEARLEAEVARAQTRIAEAAEGVSRGDDGAVEAALTAYQQIVDETLSEDAGGTPGSERAALAFEHHRSVLIALVGRVPGQAAEAIAGAIAKSDNAIRKLEHATPPAKHENGRPATPPTQRPHPTPHGPKPTDAPGATQRPNGPDPDKTPKPDHTPKPDDKTPRPQHTSRGNGG
jgi:hypothetical protein